MGNNGSRPTICSDFIQRLEFLLPQRLQFYVQLRVLAFANHISQHHHTSSPIPVVFNFGISRGFSLPKVANHPSSNGDFIFRLCNIIYRLIIFQEFATHLKP